MGILERVQKFAVRGSKALVSVPLRSAYSLEISGGCSSAFVYIINTAKYSHERVYSAILFLLLLDRVNIIRRENTMRS